jgi:hypothetical protein
MAEIVVDVSGGGALEPLALAARFVLGWTVISFGAAGLWALAAWQLRRRRSVWT